MSKFIVVIVPDEAKAYEGSKALRELHAEGSLTLYGMAIVAKTADGKLVTEQYERAQALLKDHHEAHEILAQQLLKQEAVSGSVVKEALEKTNESSVSTAAR
jgi:hypothetical protein